jgi:hypothetical protein
VRALDAFIRLNLDEKAVETNLSNN